MTKWVMHVLLMASLVLVACGGPESPPTPAPAPTSDVLKSPLATDVFESPLGLPNPASQYCVEQGYTLEIRDEAGGQVGYCIFPDGSECEEWAFYRGECSAP